jgi:hypothetical protein
MTTLDLGQSQYLGTKKEKVEHRLYSPLSG